jgi:hypothetical protein
MLTIHPSWTVLEVKRSPRGENLTYGKAINASPNEFSLNSNLISVNSLQLLSAGLSTLRFYEGYEG